MKFVLAGIQTADTTKWKGGSGFEQWPCVKLGEVETQK